ncbi:hypothetical protein CBR_g66635 [Chara braunii]|uniref:Uncharacterized protein n=1 Tax=Chara braunii TaxID=69332 RepID=A0A388JPX7_CHABU|nr:hypothetical protein CBR_g66635 [Chara braunii]|eukprot:GBG59831.1 hypothetical protein CBR_g66635 [Chara braunii]
MANSTPATVQQAPAPQPPGNLQLALHQPYPAPYQPSYYPPPPPPYGWQGAWNTPSVPPQVPSANEFPDPGNRAWFTKEHLDLIERWKTRGAIEDAKKKDGGESSGTTSTRTNKKEKGKKSSGSNIDGSEERIKAWISTLSKMKTRSKSRSGGIKVRQPRILISSDDEDQRRKARENCTIEVKHEMPANEGDKKLEAILNILGSLVRQTKMKDGEGDIREKEKLEEDTTTDTESKIEMASVKGKEALEEDKEEEEISDDSTEAEEDDGEEEKGKEGDVIKYMKGRLDHYMCKTLKEVKVLCTKRGLKCIRKDKGAWELAKQDTEQYTKLVNKEDEDETDHAEASDEAGSEQQTDDDDDVAGN